MRARHTSSIGGHWSSLEPRSELRSAGVCIKSRSMATATAGSAGAAATRGRPHAVRSAARARRGATSLLTLRALLRLRRR
jgi:hypothetical protein